MSEQIYNKYKNVAAKLLESLSERQKEIIIRRFGLDGKKEKETLEKIGKDFSITRERVRQIEADAFKKLKKIINGREIREIYFIFSGYLKKSGGLKKEDIALLDLGGLKNQNYVYFFLSLADNFYRFPENNDFYAFWAKEKKVAEDAKKLLDEVVVFFNKRKAPILENEFYELNFAKDKRFFNSFIEATKKIGKNPLGYFGLSHWPEIRPKGVRDKAYLTLKKEGRPLHFREIAKMSESLLNDNGVLPQTVHNELIKDEKFVLVGRGVYALREWGYEPGTVREIISNILKEKGPMAKDELIKEVLKARMVKENTVLLNLQNRNYFDRDENGNYLLKEA